MAAEPSLKHDITLEVVRHLDRHLAFPLLEFLQAREVYPHDEIEAAKLELIQQTNMVDFAVDIYRGLHQTDEVPEALVRRRGEVVARLHSLEASVKTVTEFMSNDENVKLLKTDKGQNLAFLQKEFGVGPEHVDALFHYAKFNFECGNYARSSELLFHYRTLSLHPGRNIQALWGKLASDVLLQDFDAAMDDVLKLKDSLEQDTFSPVAKQLQQKAWLMHWALFVFFNHENGMNALVDMFLTDRYVTAIQLAAPHLLRYAAVAAVVNKRRRSALKEVVRLVASEAYEYRDPVTEFLRLLYVEYDFEGAQAALAGCPAVLEADYFLVAARDAFLEAARQFLFETYCRVHQAIDVRALAARLGQDEGATEKWVVNLIRNARLAAKIDSKAGTVVMQAQAQSAYEQLLERARGLSLRTFALANTVVGTLKT